MECVFLSEVFPPLIPSFPWSVPETFPFSSFNIHHPENWFGSNGQPVPVSVVFFLLYFCVSEHPSEVPGEKQVKLFATKHKSYVAHIHYSASNLL